MRALTVKPLQADTAEVRDVPDPEPGVGELLVKGIALGVCGTDREIIAGEYGWAPPGRDRLVLGHESLGGILNDFSAAPAKTRLIAHDVVARTILRWWYSGADMRTRTAALNENALDPTAFERLIHRIRTAMPPLDDSTKD